MPKLVKAVLSEKIKKTAVIETFRFIPQERVEFISGQFSQIIFDDKDLGNKELNKYLSFSSSPGKEYIEITKRISDSPFSKRLVNLRIGDKVLFKSPLGNCIVKDTYKKICFLIGGIGITPVISIIGDIIENKKDTDIILFYSNRTEEDIAFKKELNDWSEVNTNLKVYYVITDCESIDSRCISGFINKELILEKMKDFKDRIFFIFGPPKMTEAMKNLCLEIGCGEKNVRMESFIGY